MSNMDNHRKMLRDTGVGLIVFIIGFFVSLSMMVWFVIEPVEQLNTAVFVVLFLDGVMIMVCGLYVMLMHMNDKRGSEIKCNTKKKSLGLM